MSFCVAQAITVSDGPSGGIDGAADDDTVDFGTSADKSSAMLMRGARLAIGLRNYDAAGNLARATLSIRDYLAKEVERRADGEGDTQNASEHADQHDLRGTLATATQHANKAQQILNFLVKNAST